MQPQKLHWDADAKRWYLGDKPIHAGSVVLARGIQHGHGPSAWSPYRIESEDNGRVIFLVLDGDTAGIEWRCPLTRFSSDHEIRTPWERYGTPKLAWPET